MNMLCMLRYMYIIRAQQCIIYTRPLSHSMHCKHDAPVTHNPQGARRCCRRRRSTPIPRACYSKRSCHCGHAEARRAYAPQNCIARNARYVHCCMYHHHVAYVRFVACRVIQTYIERVHYPYAFAPTAYKIHIHLLHIEIYIYYAAATSPSSSTKDSPSLRVTSRRVTSSSNPPSSPPHPAPVGLPLFVRCSYNTHSLRAVYMPCACVLVWLCEFAAKFKVNHLDTQREAAVR